MPDTPLMPAAASLLTGGQRYGGKSIPVDQAIGAAASLGICLAVLRMVSSVYRSSKSIEQDPSDRMGFDANVHAAGGTFYSYFRRWLRRMLLDDDGTNEIIIPAIDGAIITHQGSCHCESVAFEMIGPRCLSAEEGNGKIHYNHVLVKYNKFRVVRGQDCLKTYYVSSRRSSNRGAHAFCERCGVHILFAPAKNSPKMRVNVDCVSEGIGRVRIVKSTESSDDGVPVREQWDDQLSTISEVTQDTQLFHFQSQESSLSGGSGMFGSNGDDFTPTNSRLTIQKRRTPPTLESFSTESQFPHLRLDTGRHSMDSLSVSAANDFEFAPPSSPAGHRLSSDFSVTSAATMPTTMPEMRDNMKRFMKKHIHSSNSTSATSLTSATSASSFADDKLSATQQL